MVGSRKIGQVIRILRDKGYGFIKVDGDRDYFFHMTDLQDCSIDDLQDGTANEIRPTTVSFTVVQGKQGKLQAEAVRIED